MRQPGAGRLYKIWLAPNAPANAGEGDLWMPSAAPTSPLERQRRWVAMSLRLDGAKVDIRMKDFMRSLLVSFLGALAAIVITTLAAIVLRVAQEQANWQAIHDILARETDEMREMINAMTGKE